IYFCGDLFISCLQAEDGIRDRNVTGVQTCALPISYIIVSGGNSINHITEAKAMKLWLLKNNIPQHNIIEESSSKDTVENAIYSMKIVKKKLNSITLITSDSHMKRAYILFKELDYHNKIFYNITFNTKKKKEDYNREDSLIKKELKKLKKKNYKKQIEGYRRN